MKTLSLPAVAGCLKKAGWPQVRHDARFYSFGFLVSSHSRYVPGQPPTDVRVEPCKCKPDEVAKMAEALCAAGFDAVLVMGNANVHQTELRVFSGPVPTWTDGRRMTPAEFRRRLAAKERQEKRDEAFEELTKVAAQLDQLQERSRQLQCTLAVLADKDREAELNAAGEEARAKAE